MRAWKSSIAFLIWGSFTKSFWSIFAGSAAAAGWAESGAVEAPDAWATGASLARKAI